MAGVKKHFEDEAREFDRIILTLIPHYAQMVEALVAAIPFEKNAPVRVVDLGCGTGTIAQSVLCLFPNAHITCLDLAENMISIAQTKLAASHKVLFVAGDFNTFTFEDPYDVAISSLALHHLVTAENKLRFYRQIYESLEPGGVFYNADVVLASSEHLQQVYMEHWRAFHATDHLQ
jgi:tRNA (cmo5U34)-methyltransferase